MRKPLKKYSVLIILLTVTVLTGLIFTKTLSARDTSPAEIRALDEETLKNNIAARVRNTRGAQDEAFKTFSAARVRIANQKSVQIGDLTVYAVQVQVHPPEGDGPPDILSVVVDAGGAYQFAEIQNLADGRSLVRDALAEVKRIDDLPPDFGKVVFEGEGAHTMVVVSDPFCPYCRKGWEYVMERRTSLKTLRFAHFPLNAASEAAVWAVTDAQVRDDGAFEMLDFAYTRLNRSQNPQDIVAHYLQTYPELKSYWGEDAAQALQYLRDTYQAAAQQERNQAQALGISSTPIFFVNGEMVQGFNAAKLDDLLK